MQYPGGRDRIRSHGNERKNEIHRQGELRQISSLSVTITASQINQSGMSRSTSNRPNAAVAAGFSERTI